MKKINRKNLILFLSILGPGIITANVDNDAGGIATYSVAGAHFGYSLLWTLIPITVALIVVQEMVARMGVVTGKTLGDLIRENFGVKATFYLMLCLIIADLGNTVAEFAGWAASMEIFGVSKCISAPKMRPSRSLPLPASTLRPYLPLALGQCFLFFRPQFCH